MKEIEIIVEKIILNLNDANIDLATTLIDEHNLVSSKQWIFGLFLLNSKCATKSKEMRYLQQLMSFKPLKSTTLLYRGSEHGWMAINFHSRCDKKGQTVCLFKIKDGDCIGGFTTAYWSSDGKHVDDSEAMLFNLSCYR